MSDIISERTAVDFIGAGFYVQGLTYGLSFGYDENKNAFAVTGFDQVSAGVAVSGGYTINLHFDDFSFSSEPYAAVGIATPTGFPAIAAGALQNLV